MDVQREKGGLGGILQSCCDRDTFAYTCCTSLHSKWGVHSFFEIIMENIKDLGKMNYVLLLLAVIVMSATRCYGQHDVTWDRNGYIMYCPCMGRFGNQADQFLGALRFAERLNRTMVVPPWIAYNSHTGTSFTSYDTWFDFGQLKKFHRLILMSDFMTELAPKHWPDDGKSRKIYCPQAATRRSKDLKSCPAKDGNPFGPFWDSFNIDFTGGSEVYPSSLSIFSSKEQWNAAYPPKDHPVITLMGAPSGFPTEEHNRDLQKYVKWSKEVKKMASDFIDANIGGPFVGIHLRNGIDWVRACKHVDGTNPHFMSSPQCVGYVKYKALKLTQEMCLPPKDMILQNVLEIIKKYNATTLFVATDKDAMVNEFKNLPVKVVRYFEDYPVLDLAILTYSEAFIGNCVSSFTAFVVRHREVEGKPNYFFAFDREQNKSGKTSHQDL